MAPLDYTKERIGEITNRAANDIAAAQFLDVLIEENDKFKKVLPEADEKTVYETTERTLNYVILKATKGHMQDLDVEGNRTPQQLLALGAGWMEVSKNDVDKSTRLLHVTDKGMKYADAYLRAKGEDSLYGDQTKRFKSTKTA